MIPTDETSTANTTTRSALGKDSVESAVSQGLPRWIWRRYGWYVSVGIDASSSGEKTAAPRCMTSETPRENPDVRKQAYENDECYEDTTPKRGHDEDERCDADSDVRVTASRGEGDERPETEACEETRHSDDREQKDTVPRRTRRSTLE